MRKGSIAHITANNKNRTRFQMRGWSIGYKADIGKCVVHLLSVQNNVFVTSVTDIDDVASCKRAERGDIGCLHSIIGIFKYWFG